MHPYRTVLDCIEPHRTVSYRVNILDLLIKYAIALRNHQLYTELSLWRLIFLPLVFFGFCTFHDVLGQLKCLLREGYSVRHCAEEMGKSKGAIHRLKKKLEGKN